MRANLSYVVEAYLPSDSNGAVQREKEVPTLTEANTLAREWSAEGFEVDLVQRAWYGASDIRYSRIDTVPARA